jgi:hypothetical protein
MTVRTLRDDCYTPVAMASAIPWEDMKHAIVLTVDKDGFFAVDISYVPIEVACWMSMHLQKRISRELHNEEQRS